MNRLKELDQARRSFAASMMVLWATAKMSAGTMRRLGDAARKLGLATEDDS